MIVLASVFRDATDYLDRYFSQIDAFRRHMTEPVYVIGVEGDSEDATYKEMVESGKFDEILKAEHGGQKYGSVVHPMRWRQLSVACNAALCAAVRVIDANDQFVYVESDLIWDSHMMRSLLDDLFQPGIEAVAPMSMFDRTSRFYDVWGHTKNGECFSERPPHHPHLDGKNLTSISTAGSCFALRASMVPLVEFSAKDCIRGIGRSLADAGHTLYLDPNLAVRHPW